VATRPVPDLQCHSLHLGISYANLSLNLNVTLLLTLTVTATLSALNPTNKLIKALFDE